MSRLRHSRPSPALVVAVFALVAALAGTAVAEQATTSVSKKKTKKIAKKQVNKVLPIGNDELAEIAEHSEDVSIPSSGFDALTVSCEESERILSGGFRWEGIPPATATWTQLDHRENNGWRAGGSNFSGSPKNFIVHAYCLTTG
jgi:hypothetical protein